MSAPKLPDLEFQPPDCPLCGEETNPVDDCFDCESCNLSWDRHGERGERMDPQLPQCLAECTPYDGKLPNGGLRYSFLAGNRYACVLDAGHVGEDDQPHRGVRIDESDLEHDTHVWKVETVPA